MRLLAIHIRNNSPVQNGRKSYVKESRRASQESIRASYACFSVIRAAQILDRHDDLAVARAIYRGRRRAISGLAGCAIGRACEREAIGRKQCSDIRSRGGTPCESRPSSRCSCSLVARRPRQHRERFVAGSTQQVETHLLWRDIQLKAKLARGLTRPSFLTARRGCARLRA